jgi:hypothetical protein
MSRIMARASATPALAPIAWTMRHPMIIDTSVDRAHPAEPSVKITKPSAIGLRRPNLSLTGPQNNWPRPNPSR